MDTIEILRQLAIIVLAAKFFGLVARKVKAPMVAGEIIAGLIIGPSLLGLVQPSDFLQGLAEIGVIMLMFSAGLGTDIRQLKATGVKSTVIACAGVLVPLIGGTILYMCFYGFSSPGQENFLKAVFIGTILTATSVSITVETLKELGRLSEPLGTTIMSAAIIDDVIGIVVLTIVIGFKDPEAKIINVAFRTALFFVFSLGVGIIAYHIFKKIDQRYPHTRRIPIMGMALAFIMSYLAAEFFGVADITGAYIAGVILSSLDDSDYISRKMDVNSYMLFGPVFFCSIGLQTNIRDTDMSIILFSIGFVLVGLVSKIVGCSGASMCMGYNMPDSLRVGIGMMTRGEVALIVAQRGLAAGLMKQSYFTAVILLIIVSSILTPILLKIAYDKGTPDVS